MKLKFYLRGLGVGILVTTFILTVSYGFRDAQPVSTAENSSTKASILNSTKAEKTSAAQTAETQATTTTQNVEAKTEIQTQTAASAPIETPTELSTEAPTEVPTEVSNKTPVVVSLTGVSYSEQAAQLIQNAGIVADWKDFNAYLISSGYASKIHNGTYSLYPGQDYESIAKIITGK